MKINILKSLAMAAMLVSLAGTVQAAQITGGISLNGGYTVNTGDLNNATAFSTFQGVLVTSVSGSFSGAGITLYTPNSVTMTPFAFNPFPISGVVPLWITTIGTLASFDLLSLTSRTQGGNALELRGTGTLHLGTYDATPGDWIFTANQSTSTFSWSSSNGAQVPDGGVTLILLGAALSSLALIRRKLA